MKKLIIEQAEIRSFGCLKNVVVTPSDGVNLLYAPNESGKTTFAAFVKFMLYGFSGTMKRSVSDNERTLYLPWDGSKATGTLILGVDNEKYKIERVCDMSSDKCVVTEMFGKRESRNDLKPGVTLLGVEEETFSRTAFFRQTASNTSPGRSQTADTDSEKFAASFKNIALTPEESAAVKNALTNLTSVKNRIANRQSHGLYFDADAERGRLQSEYDAAMQASEDCERAKSELIELEAEAAKLRQSIESLNAELSYIEKYEAAQTLKTIESLCQAADEAVRSYAEAKKGVNDSAPNADGLISANDEYQKALQASLSADASLEEARAECAKASEDNKLSGGNAAAVSKKLKDKRVCGFTFVIAAILLAIGGTVTLALDISVLPFVLFGITLPALAAAASFLSAPKRLARTFGYASADELKKALADEPYTRARAEQAAKALSQCEQRAKTASATAAALKAELEKRISAFCPPDASGDYAKQIRAISALLATLEVKKKAASDARLVYENALSNVNIDEIKLLASGAGSEKPARERKTVKGELSINSRRLDIYNDKIREKSNDISRLGAMFGDPSMLKGKIQALELRMANLKRTAAAIKTASDVIEETREKMKSEVGPRVSAIAGSYFGALTSGKYDSLDTSNDLALGFGSTGKSCDFLSTGTRECAYISLRLALSDIMYPSVKPFAFLDDAFGHIDDDRLVNVMKLVNAFSAEHQVFVLSCRAHEKRALDEAGIAYTTTELKQC